MRVANALSVDVEENFHATEVGAPAAWWPSLPSRVCAQTGAVLSLLDDYSVRATFFILGWVAERHPEVARAIAAAGHQIGCHSYAHRLVSTLTPAEFREDTRRAVAAIEDACGVTPRLYRAPSYSITAESLWALEVLVECGFTHDSSIYPIRHDRYGIPDFGRQPRTVATPAGSIVEIPVATAVALGRNVPVGGGGYLRLLPYRYTAAGIRRINAAEPVRLRLLPPMGNRCRAAAPRAQPHRALAHLYGNSPDAREACAPARGIFLRPAVGGLRGGSRSERAHTHGHHVVHAQRFLHYERLAVARADEVAVEARHCRQPLADLRSSPGNSPPPSGAAPYCVR